MNVLQNFHLAVIKYLYRGVARSLCRRLLLDSNRKIVHSYGFVNHFYAMHLGNYQFR